jgi:hypothetical protein
MGISLKIVQHIVANSIDIFIIYQLIQELNAIITRYSITNKSVILATKHFGIMFVLASAILPD